MRTTLVVLAIALNLVSAAFYFHCLRRAKRALLAAEGLWISYWRLVAFASFITTDECGAPEPIRNYAREALPPDTFVQRNASHTLH